MNTTQRKFIRTKFADNIRILVVKKKMNIHLRYSSGKNFFVEFITLNIEQNKTLPLIFLKPIYFLVLFINNKKNNSDLSSNKYEIGKDIAPQNKNTSHIYN